MLTAAISFHVRVNKRDEVISALDALVERMRRAPGCQKSHLFADVEDGSGVLMLSEWSDFASASSYFDSTDFQVFRGLRILFQNEPYVILDEVSGRVSKTLREVAS